MSGTSKRHGANNSRSTESDIDETITVILVALAKGLGGAGVVVGVVPDDQHPHLRQRVGRVPIRTGVRSRARGGVRAGPGGLVATLARIVSAVGDQRIRTRWRTWWVYRHRWTAICTLHGLTAKLDDRTLVPALRSVTIGATSDVVVVRILTGQSVADWQNRAAALAEAFRARAGHDPLHQARRN